MAVYGLTFASLMMDLLLQLPWLIWPWPIMFTVSWHLVIAILHNWYFQDLFPYFLEQGGGYRAVLLIV